MLQTELNNVDNNDKLGIYWSEASASFCGLNVYNGSLGFTETRHALWQESEQN